MLLRCPDLFPTKLRGIFLHQYANAQRAVGGNYSYLCMGALTEWLHLLAIWGMEKPLKRAAAKQQKLFSLRPRSEGQNGMDDD
jgi:hypothetical protein